MPRSTEFSREVRHCQTGELLGWIVGTYEQLSQDSLLYKEPLPTNKVLFDPYATPMTKRIEFGLLPHAAHDRIGCHFYTCRPSDLTKLRLIKGFVPYHDPEE